MTPGSATAASLPAGLAKFAHCPVNDPKVTLCLYSKTTSTNFEIGSTTVTTTSPTTLCVGVTFNRSDHATVVLPDDSSAARQAPATPIPGGLLGIPRVDGGVQQLTATPQLVGFPPLSPGNLLRIKGAGQTLPIDVLVSGYAGSCGSSRATSEGSPACLGVFVPPCEAVWSSEPARAAAPCSPGERTPEIRAR